MMEAPYLERAITIVPPPGRVLESDAAAENR
jgi:hypothetical protein